MKRINEIINSLEFGKNKPSPFSKDQIFVAFKQDIVSFPLLLRLGGGGNCASVAIIKAAIATYGFDNVFKSIVIDDVNKRFLIDLRDDDETLYSLYFEDYDFAAGKSAFELNANDQISKDIWEFAKFCFAVMAEVKRYNYRLYKKYWRAVTDLNKGEGAEFIHEYLGLEVKKIKDVSIQNLSAQKNMILWNEHHAVYSSEGFYDECFNENKGVKLEGVQKLSELQMIHGDGSNKPMAANILL